MMQEQESKKRYKRVKNKLVLLFIMVLTFNNLFSQELDSISIKQIEEIEAEMNINRNIYFESIQNTERLTKKELKKEMKQFDKGSKYWLKTDYIYATSKYLLAGYFIAGSHYFYSYVIIELKNNKKEYHFIKGLFIDDILKFTNKSLPKMDLVTKRRIECALIKFYFEKDTYKTSPLFEKIMSK